MTIIYYWSKFDLKDTNINQVLPSLHGVSFETMLTVSLRDNFDNFYITQAKLNHEFSEHKVKCVVWSRAS